ncbi:S8 family serine peptidase [Lagierella sp.]|uniref:S8 family serine peptidase n=1 Tax=Lagierella sp. TaxID=2849657 RepID=UPI0026091F80|nr:S8 family serine peptidase [Lagierella sp.]
MKKVVSSLLAFSLCLSVASTSLATKDKVQEATKNDELELSINKREKLNLMISVDSGKFPELGKSIDSVELKDDNNKIKQIEFAKKVNKKALELIRSKGIKFELYDSLELIDIAIMGKASYEDFIKIQNLDFVKSVDIAEEYDEPKTEDKEALEETIKMISSRKMIGANKLAEKYDGRGRVVAVLDSAFDINHPAFYLSANGKQAAKLDSSAPGKVDTSGRYINEKIPFIFNYAEKNTDVSRGDEHGQHVAGIVGANRKSVTISGQSYDHMGVAPEAQLLLMDVFPERGGTSSNIYLKAIDDAAKIGADSINMSLGTTAGQLYNTNREGITRAIENANNMGSVVVIASGNEGHIGWKDGKNPKSYNPDYGIVSTPAVSPSAMAVASIENFYDESKTGNQLNIDFRDGENEKVAIRKLSGSPYLQEGFKYASVFVGNGKNNTDIPDLSNKVAIVEADFEKPDPYSDSILVDKEGVENIISKKPAAILIYSKKSNLENLYTTIKADVPIYAIPTNVASLLRVKNDAEISLIEGNGYAMRFSSGEMSSFSNWGLTADGDLKPEITAPGGQIYSTVFSSNYKYKEGTSMATPHVSGGIAVVRTRIDEEFTNIGNDEKERLVRNILMSSANPHKDQNTEALTSPRKQGAGVMDLVAALNTDVIIYDTKTKDSKINLRNVGESFELNFTVRNLSRDVRTFNYKTYLNTDDVEGDTFSLRPRLLKEIPGQSLSLAGGQTKDITIKVDSSEFTDDLEEKMPNGYFLEGFVTLESNDKSEPNISIPYCGFCGDFNGLDVFEPFIYNLVKENKLPYYYNGTGRYPMYNDGFTHFETKINNRPAILGQEYNFDSRNPKFTELAISPYNNDGYNDSMSLTFTLLRNSETTKADVYKYDNDVKGDHVANVFSTGIDSNNLLRKNHFGTGTPLTPKRYTIAETKVNQLFPKVNDERYPDGKYLYEVTGKGASSDKEVTDKVPFYIDSVAPKAVNVSLMDGVLTFDGLDELSGILYTEASTNGIVLERIDGRSFKVPTGVNLSDIDLKIVDLAYNTTVGKADTFKESAIIEPGDDMGNIKINPIVKDGEKMPKFTITAISSYGTEYTDLSNLPIGVYTIKISDLEDGYTIESSQPIKVEITKNNLNPVINITFSKEILKKQLISIGLFSKYSVTVTSSDKVGKVYVYRGKEIDENNLLLKEKEQGTLNLRPFKLKRGDLLTFVIKADGYEDVITTRKVRR